MVNYSACSVLFRVTAGHTATLLDCPATIPLTGRTSWPWPRSYRVSVTTSTGISWKLGKNQMEKGFDTGRGLLGHSHIERLSQHQQVFHENWVKARQRRVSTLGEVVGPPSYRASVTASTGTSWKLGKSQTQKGFDVWRGLLGHGHIERLSQRQQVFHENRVVEGRWRGGSSLGEVCWAKTTWLVCCSINRYLVKIGLRPNRGVPEREMSVGLSPLSYHVTHVTASTGIQ